MRDSCATKAKFVFTLIVCLIRKTEINLTAIGFYEVQNQSEECSLTSTIIPNKSNNLVRREIKFGDRHSCLIPESLYKVINEYRDHGNS